MSLGRDYLDGERRVDRLRVAQKLAKNSPVELSGNERVERLAQKLLPFAFEVAERRGIGIRHLALQPNDQEDVSHPEDGVRRRSAPKLAQLLLQPLVLRFEAEILARIDSLGGRHQMPRERSG